MSLRPAPQGTNGSSARVFLFGLRGPRRRLHGCGRQGVTCPAEASQDACVCSVVGVNREHRAVAGCSALCGEGGSGCGVGLTDFLPTPPRSALRPAHSPSSWAPLARKARAGGRPFLSASPTPVLRVLDCRTVPGPPAAGRHPSWQGAGRGSWQPRVPGGLR